MQVKDSQVFLVSGYTGDRSSMETLFTGQIIAVDHKDAKTSMCILIGDLMITGATSLDDLKRPVATMEKVKSSEIVAPVSEAAAALN